MSKCEKCGSENICTEVTTGFKTVGSKTILTAPSLGLLSVCKDCGCHEQSSYNLTKKPEKFVLFYGGIFSQWYSVSFVGNFSTWSKKYTADTTFNCAEQYMMAGKAVIFDDHESYKKIMASTNPREQKALGKRVKGFDKEKWERVAKEIVYNGNYYKFTQNSHILKGLQNARGRTLVEASPYDTIWGIGVSQHDPRALSRDRWLGTNWLGEIITKLREDLSEKSLI